MVIVYHQGDTSVKGSWVRIKMRVKRQSECDSLRRGQSHSLCLFTQTKKIAEQSLFVMQMCYNTPASHESGEPYRSGTGEDRLPCPPRDRRQFCMTANTMFTGNTGHISLKRTTWLRVVHPYRGALLVSVHSFQARPGLSVSALERESAPLFHVPEWFRAL